ncbi:MAG: hypothetical protein ACYSU7_15490, partial [Planctomycetota bacterium]
MKRRNRQSLLFASCTLVLACVVGAIALAWHLREHRDTYFTDADTIRRPIDAATPRDILWRPPVGLPQIVNTPGDEHGPVISPDGATLFFVRGQAGQNTDIYFCARTPAGWSRPQALGVINSEGDELGPAPSPDGRALYFTSNRPGGFGNYDLWVTRRDGDRWTTPVNLGDGVNTRNDETGPGPTPDGLLLYFASNRPRPVADIGREGSQDAVARAGDFDLYVAGLDNASMTAVPVLALNTPHDEAAATVSPAGDFVYFSSDRPGGEGGFDLYRSRNLEGAYTTPRNLGPPVNTTANELDPAVSLGGFGLHYAAMTDEGAGYDLLYTTSREVFTRSDAYRASLDWGALWAMIWPWLLATVIAAALLLALIRALTRLQYRRLTLLAKCLLVSLLVHMLLMLSFAFWSVSAAAADYARPGEGMRVVLTSPSIGAGLAAQIRGELTDVQVADAVPQPAEDRQRQDSTASLPPSAVPAPLTPPTEVARSRIDTPETPTVTNTSREAPSRSTELPAPDLAAASPVAETETLEIDLPSGPTRSDQAEAAVSVRVPSAAAAVDQRVPAEAFGGAPAVSSAVTFEPPSTDPLSHPSPLEPLAEAVPQGAAPRHFTAAVPGAQRAPNRSLDLNLPAMPSAPSARRDAQPAEAQLEVGGVGGEGGVMRSTRGVEVTLPVNTAPGQATPR